MLRERKESKHCCSTSDIPYMCKQKGTVALVYLDKTWACLSLRPWQRSFICHMEKEFWLLSSDFIDMVKVNPITFLIRWPKDKQAELLFFPVISSYICIQSVTSERSHYAVPDFAKTCDFWRGCLTYSLRRLKCKNVYTAWCIKLRASVYS